MGSLADLTAVEARSAIGRRELSPVDLLEACIERIERVDPRLNAIVAVDYDRARAEAKSAAQAVQRGDALGPLHGLPVGIKDLNLTEGLRTTFGSEIFAEHVPQSDERLVAAIRQAGGIVVAKTNTPEFGAGANTTNRVYGPTGNPFDPELTCGGSSGGSAVALATGMLPLCTGSDLGGSLRTPAAFCGVVGFRPSPGVVPHELRLTAWNPLPQQGPMGRTVADAALLLSAIAGRDARDPFASSGVCAEPMRVDLSTLRVAISTDFGFAPVAAGIRETFAKAVAGFRHVFASAEERDPPVADADEIFSVLRAVGVVGARDSDYRERRDKLGPNVLANVEQGLGMSLLDVARAQVKHSALYRRFLDFMADYDVLIAPAAAVSPFPHSRPYVEEIDGRPMPTYFSWLALAYGLTLTVHPVVALPCGVDNNGLPFGIQVCGRHGGDTALLGVAAALEGYLAATPRLQRPVPDLTRLMN